MAKVAKPRTNKQGAGTYSVTWSGLTVDIRYVDIGKKWVAIAPWGEQGPLVETKMRAVATAKTMIAEQLLKRQSASVEEDF